MKTIIDTKTQQLIAVAGDYDQAFVMAHMYLSYTDPEGATALHAERSDLRVRGQPSPGARFYVATCEDAFVKKMLRPCKKFFIGDEGQVLTRKPRKRKIKEKDGGQPVEDKLAYLDGFDDGGCANGHCPVK